MKVELVKIDPIEFGLTDETAKGIQQQFEPMLAKMSELESEFNEVVTMPIDDPKTSKKAKELRNKYVKVRTATAEIHKTQKSFYLNGGRFVDGWKNAQLFASQGKEARLEEIENYLALQEKAKRDAILEERINLISPFVENANTLGLSLMADDVFEAYLKAKKQDYADRLEAERKAEEERLAEIKAEQERIEAQRIENEKLKAEAEKREKEIEIERKRKEQELIELQAKADAERKEQQSIIEKERAEREFEAKKQSEIIEAQRKEAEKITKELQAKADAEAKLESERIAKLEQMALAPDKEKLSIWVKSSELAESPKVNAKCSKVAKDIKAKHEAFLVWANTQIESI